MERSLRLLHAFFKRSGKFFLLLCVRSTFAQNLVPDSSFENNTFVPLEFSEIYASKNWSRPTLGTSDLFCRCSRKQAKYSLVNVPHNPMGNQWPRSGPCHGGFFAHSHGDYREYLQTPLSRALEKDKVYRFRMHISLADYSRAAVDKLGVCFLQHKMKFKSTGPIEDEEPLYLEIEKPARTDTVHWQSLSGYYKAKGGEVYLLIGSFVIDELRKIKTKAPREARSRINQRTDRDAYYYVDDVSLIEVTDSAIVKLFDKKTIPLPVDTGGDPPSIPAWNAILFASNKAEISATSLPALELLANYLIDHQEIALEVSGHTDNSGSARSNQRLSENRAKAVCDHLLLKGVDEKQLSFKGYGSLRPVADNESVEGRSRNRRIEFRMIRLIETSVKH